MSKNSAEVSLVVDVNNAASGNKKTITKKGSRSSSISSHDGNMMKEFCGYEGGCIVCLVYACVDLNCCCCCPCEFYIHMGWSLFLYVAFTFGYEIYAIFWGGAIKMELIVYLLETFICDLPIMIFVYINKPRYLIFPWVIQFIVCIGHIFLTGIYFGHDDITDGILMITTDVPFEIILWFCLIPFFQEKIPLWEKRDFTYVSIENSSGTGSSSDNEEDNDNNNNQDQSSLKQHLQKL